MRIIYYITAAFLVIAAPAFGQSEILVNQTIIELSQAGLGSEAIIAKIKSTSGRYDMSTSQLIALKRANVSDGIIAAMLEASTKPQVSANAFATSSSPNPLDPHPSGLYFLPSNKQKMFKVDANNSSQTKNSGGIASALTYGIAKRKVKAVLPNPTARIRTSDLKPEFYFYFDNSTTNLSQSGQNSGFSAILGTSQTPVTSPNEFTLIKLQTVKANREIDLGSANISGMKMGASDKQRVAFDYQEIAAGVYKVIPTADLLPGEYGFIYSSSAGNVSAMYGLGGSSTKVFDFGVDGNLVIK